MANNDDEFDVLRNSPAPAPRAQAKERALEAARAAFNLEKTSAAAQGTQNGLRLTERATRLWSEIMQRKLIATPALAGLVALPVAGYATFYLLQEAPFGVSPQKTVSETAAPAEKPADTLAKAERDALSRDNALPDVAAQLSAEPQSTPRQEAPAASATALQESIVAGSASPNAAPTPADAARSRAFAPSVASKQMADQAIASLPAPPEPMRPEAESRDRIEDFKSNPVRSALEDPVSTFSIDVDTASYSFVRRSLKEGLLPQPDTVRVEEMINYFPYDWKGPDEASTPFNSTITVMPTPWNDNTRLMHVAIKGYDVQPAEKPKANLVFLLDVSGSMDEPDKLPLLKSAFRLLVNKLGPDDTVSIVTYAGNAGTVLEPTKASEREKILNAVDTLTPGGSTAGGAGIREAYRLAEKSFVKDGVNRVMLATDGDFNVGQTDDNDLKRIIEEKRKSGVFLSVFGFGRGNLNDQMMQTIAQNGNGTAAYVDTLAEAEKVLVAGRFVDLVPDRQGREDPDRVQPAESLRVPADRLRDAGAQPRGLQQRPRRRGRDRLRPCGDGDLRDHAERQPGDGDRRPALRTGENRQSDGCGQCRRICLREDPLQGAGRRHFEADQHTGHLGQRSREFRRGKRRPALFRGSRGIRAEASRNRPGCRHELRPHRRNRHGGTRRRSVRLSG